MSIIHDALNRVETKTGESPKETVTDSDPGLDDNHRPIKKIIPFSLAILILGAAGYFWFDGSSIEEAPIRVAGTELKFDASPNSDEVSLPPATGGAVTADLDGVKSLTEVDVKAEFTEKMVSEASGKRPVADKESINEKPVSGLTEVEIGNSETTLSEITEAEAPAQLEKATDENVGLITATNGDAAAKVPLVEPEDVSIVTETVPAVVDEEDAASVTRLTEEAIVERPAPQESPHALFESTQSKGAEPMQGVLPSLGQDDVGRLTGGLEERPQAKSPAVGKPPEQNRAVAGLTQEEEAATADPVALDQRGKIADGKSVKSEPLSSPKKQQSVSNLPALLAQAKLKEQQADPRGALADYQHIAERFPDNTTVILGAARSSAMLGRFSAAISWVDKLADQQRGWEHWFWSGYAKLQMNDFSAALADFDQASAQKPGDLSLLLHRSAALQKLARHKEAITLFHQARLLAPNMPEISFNIGVSWWALGDQARAMAAFSHFKSLVEGNESKYLVHLQTLRDYYQIR